MRSPQEASTTAEGLNHAPHHWSQQLVEHQHAGTYCATCAVFLMAWSWSCVLRRDITCSCGRGWFEAFRRHSLLGHRSNADKVPSHYLARSNLPCHSCMFAYCIKTWLGASLLAAKAVIRLAPRYANECDQSCLVNSGSAALSCMHPHTCCAVPDAALLAVIFARRNQNGTCSWSEPANPRSTSCCMAHAGAPFSHSA